MIVKILWLRNLLAMRRLIGDKLYSENLNFNIFYLRVGEHDKARYFGLWVLYIKIK